MEVIFTRNWGATEPGARFGCKNHTFRQVFSHQFEISCLISWRFEAFFVTLISISVCLSDIPTSVQPQCLKYTQLKLRLHHNNFKYKSSYRKARQESFAFVTRTNRTSRNVGHKRPQIDHKSSVFPCNYRLCTKPVMRRVSFLLKLPINARTIVAAHFNGFLRRTTFGARAGTESSTWPGKILS